MSDISTRCDAKLTLLPEAGMITLRGDLGSEALARAVQSVAGCAMPAPNQISGSTAQGAAWMSPDELVLFAPPADVTAACAQVGEALTGTHHLCADVSSARVIFTLTGADARDVLAKLTPADLRPAAFGPGSFRRTRVGQVAAALWQDGEHSFGLMCFRSVAGYMQGLLQTSIDAGPVGHF